MQSCKGKESDAPELIVEAEEREAIEWLELEESLEKAELLTELLKELKSPKIDDFINTQNENKFSLMNN